MTDIYDNMQKKDPPNKENVAFPAVGSIISFANIDWWVLAIENDKAFLISENVLEKRKYNNEFTDVTWETCTLRKYLNGEFYNSLGADRSKIAETKNSNPDNQWHGTDGGNTTTDKIFLLSLDEVVKYFGDSGQLNNPPKDDLQLQSWWIDDEYRIDDEYNSARIAKDKSGKVSWWWLRSPGGYSVSAAPVFDDGNIGVGGYYVDIDSGGVRPALWLNLYV